jgi:hypothetical protein
VSVRKFASQQKPGRILTPVRSPPLSLIDDLPGTLITNLYFMQRLDPAKVHALLLQSNVHSLLPPSIFASAREGGTSYDFSQGFSISSFLGHIWHSTKTGAAAQSDLLQLSTYAEARATYGAGQSSCLERRGAAVALHVNTMYMTVSILRSRADRCVYDDNTDGSENKFP